MVALLVSATMFFSCKDDVARVEAIEDVSKIPTMRIDSLEISSMFGGKLKRLIRTPQVRLYSLPEEEYYEFSRGGYVETYNDSLKLEMTITSKHAIHQVKPTEMWIATDSVVVRNLLKNQTVYTDTLYWDMEKREIYTHSPVKIVTSDIMLIGDHGMRSDDQFRDYALLNMNDGALYLNRGNLQKNDSIPNTK